MTTVREALIAAAREAARPSYRQGAAATRRRNALMVYAFDRGVTVRELCNLTGLTSTSTVAGILERGGAQRGSVLDERAPRRLAA